MSVVLDQRDVGPCRQELDVEVPKAAVEAETNRVVANFQKFANIPGFRKGKAPLGLVKNRHREDIEKEVVERLLPRYWRQAEAEKSLKPILAPQVKDVNFEMGEALTFTAIVELRPEVTLQDYRAYDLPAPEVEPQENEIEEAINDLRRKVAPWEPVERAAAQGDVAKIRIREEGAEDDIDEDQEDGITIEVGHASIWEELSLAVTGLSADQSSSFTKEQGEEKKEFHVKVLEVQEQSLPEVDEEFVSAYTDLASLEEFNDDVVQAIRRAKVQKRAQEREMVFVERLCEEHPMDVPEGLVGREMERMVQEYATDLMYRGVNLEEAGIDWAEIAEKVRPQAERRVQSRLLLDAIAEAESIEVSEEKFEATLASIAKSEKSTPLEMRRELDKDGRLQNLREGLRREEVVFVMIGEKDAEQEENNDDEA